MLGTDVDVLFIWVSPVSLTPVHMVQDPAAPRTYCPWETCRESSSEASMEGWKGKISS